MLRGYGVIEVSDSETLGGDSSAALARTSLHGKKTAVMRSCPQLPSPPPTLPSLPSDLHSVENHIPLYVVSVMFYGTFVSVLLKHSDVVNLPLALS